MLTDPANVVGNCFTGGRCLVTLIALLVSVAVIPGASPVAALDLLSLWNQPVVTLDLVVGGWVEYKSVSLEGGRRTTELTRLQCVGRQDGDAGAWILEILPMEEQEDGSVVLVAGDGVRLWLDDRVHTREGELTDLVKRVERWQQHRPIVLEPEDWRDDPLVSSSLRSGLRASTTEELAATSRVVQGQSLWCRQFSLTAADTQSVRLPAGQMEQISSVETTLAVCSEVPLLGIAFAAERSRSESRLTPPSDRFQPPPAEVKVETVELFAFGANAVPVLEID